MTPIHWEKLSRIFEKAGFKKEREKGSHIILTKEGIDRPVVIPKYSEVGIDIIKSNMRTAKMSRKEYFRLLNE